MITIEIEDNDDVDVVADTLDEPKDIPNDFEFKRKLIREVRKHRILYDNKHKLFSNVSKKDLVWQQIANKLKSNVDSCKDTWYDIRYKYQRHARRLRDFFVQGRKANYKRPGMSLESELMFLWRVVDNRKKCELSFEILEDENTAVGEGCATDENTGNTKDTSANQKPIDDDLILVEPPVELIVIEDDDGSKSSSQYKITAAMKSLIALIKIHPEIYDSTHKDFYNYTRKSFLWNATASAMGDKATKLMKIWIVMQTRYEWEICQQKQSQVSELQIELDYFKDFILKNHDTVYKHSYFLKSGWCDPIEYFKDIYSLIVRMKKMPDIVYVTDSLLKTAAKSKQYLSLWSEIATTKNYSPGQCEITWLIMRYFYWELMNMRQENYQLTDKWYFETIITELYGISKAAQTAKQQELGVSKSNSHKKPALKRLAPADPITLGAPATKCSSPAITPLPSSVPMPVPMRPTLLNNSFQNLPAATSTMTTQTTTQQTLTLPKITGAMSLAPQALNSGSLQIKKILGPPTLSPAPFQLNNNSTNATVVSPNIVAPPPMSFTLPIQTKVTPIPMPQLVQNMSPNSNQPVLRNITPATISVLPSLPQIQVASWATSPRPSLNSTVVTQIHNNPQPPTPSFSFATSQIPAKLQLAPKKAATILNSTRGNQFSNQGEVNTFTVSSANLMATPLPSNTTASNTCLSYNNNNAVVIVNNTTPDNSTQMPKITGATSLLSPGNQQHVPLKTYVKRNATSSVSCTNTDQFTASNSTASNHSTLAAATNSARYIIPSNSAGSTVPIITGATSLLNPNEILIELITSSSGNQLLVHGPSLSSKYQLPMKMVTKFIRTILSIPILHTKQIVENSLVNSCWNHISSHFNLPVHICRAIWNFLLENFDHFPQIAPMKDLMKPFETPSELKVWSKSNILFEKFDETSSSKGWLKFAKNFPDVVDCIKDYPCLYQDVAQGSTSENVNDMESLCIWRTIGLRFPNMLNIQEIWLGLKQSFLLYMSDLEIGVDSKWSTNWWRSLARMKFLVEAKYPTTEPLYYIITNKMVEQIDKFATMEMMNITNKTEIVEPTKESKVQVQPAVDKDNIELEISASVIQTKEKLKEVELGSFLAVLQKYPIIYTKADTLEKYNAWQQVAKELSMDVTDCLFAFKTATEKYLTYKKRDPVTRLHIHEKYYKKFEEILHSLPFSKMSSVCRAKINIKTPLEINQSVETESSTEFLFPERFIGDINMSNNSSSLVVKNWIYAIGNIHCVNDSLQKKLKLILSKYLPHLKK